MIPQQALKLCIGPALHLLPAKMATPHAEAMLIAVALQESRFKHRVQISGPARSYWQFELVGIEGVMTHHVTDDMATMVLSALDYPHDNAVHVFTAIQYDQVLAAAMARLLLYTVPKPLPGRDDAEEGWSQYMSAWRPGKPHPATWDGYFKMAWDLVA